MAIHCDYTRAVETVMDRATRAESLISEGERALRELKLVRKHREEPARSQGPVMRHECVSVENMLGGFSWRERKLMRRREMLRKEAGGE